MCEICNCLKTRTSLSVFSQELSEVNSTQVRSQTNTARVDGLRPGTMYVMQVRARTVAGFGKYSSKMCFQSLTDGMNPHANACVCVCVCGGTLWIWVISFLEQIFF